MGTLNAKATIPLQGSSATVGAQILGPGWTGTLVPETTAFPTPDDPSASWAEKDCVDNAGVGHATITANIQCRIDVSGATGVRFRVSVAGSGTAYLAGVATVAGFVPPLSATVTGSFPTPLAVQPVSAPSALPVSILSFPSPQPITDPAGNQQSSIWYGTNEQQVDTLGRAFTLMPDISDSNSISCAAGNTWVFPVAGKSNIILDVAGLTSCVLTIEGVVGSGTWRIIPMKNMASSTAATTQTISANGQYRGDVSGWNQVRVRVSTFSALETAALNYNMSSAALGNYITDLNGFGRMAFCSSTSSTCAVFQAPLLAGQSGFTTLDVTADIQAAIGTGTGAGTYAAPRADAGACTAAASCADVLMVAQGGAFNDLLTSASPTSCTSIEASSSITGATQRIASLTNGGAAMGVTLTLYSDQTCTIRRWGPLSLQAGQTIPVNLVSTGGWSYALSGTLTDPLNIGYN